MFAGACAAAALGYRIIYGSEIQTSNAYVSGDPIQVTSQTGGLVKAVFASDTQQVALGQPLVELDGFDLERAMREAKFEVQANVAKHSQAIAGAEAARLSALQSVRGRHLAALAYEGAKVTHDQNRRDFDRISLLARGRWVSEKGLRDSQTSLRLSEVGVNEELLRIGQAEDSVRLADATVMQRGDDERRTAADLMAARARLDIAIFNYGRRVIRAPSDGVVIAKQITPGQRIPIGTNLMQVVPLNKLYVLANFKENQLANVRVGQSAIATSDIYGAGVVYRATVVGIAGGTGTAFSAIPVVNASGNWVKVTQRLPVRIKLNKDDLARHPLRIGLSMTVKIDPSTAGR